jgi:uncharacterized SAM-binding protein YcdF (DUF218 family)
MDSVKSTRAGSYIRRGGMSTLPSKEVSCFYTTTSRMMVFMQLKLIKKESRYRLTWQGWLGAFTCLFIVFWLLFTGIYSFLAPTSPPHRGLLIIEGWIHDDALDEAIYFYKKGSYSKIICTGVPIETGNYLLPFHSYSELTARRLYKKGIATNQILIAVGKLEKKDRTYLAAVALKELLKKEAIEEKELHLITTGPHGRRSRLLFQKALGKQYRIGITSLPDASYDPERWYAYSKGVRAVIDETIAYVYAKFLFHPAESESK